MSIGRRGVKTGRGACVHPLALVGVLTLVAVVLSTASAAAMTISEFRLRGPQGANDEFVEFYNDSVSPLVVAGANGSAGWALVASDGAVRFTIPNGVVIPAGGHYLATNSVGYGLAGYPAGLPATATGDVSYVNDIPDNAGIALFDSALPADFTMAHRLDAVGSKAEANALYREGTGYKSLTPFSIDYSFSRDQRAGAPRDTGDNEADLIFVDTNGTSAGAGQRLGAPGPENLSSPLTRTTGGLLVALVDPAVALNEPPNQVRDLTSIPQQNSTFGTLEIRRKITNHTGAPLTRLRLRIVDLSTFPAPAGTADLRPITSGAATITLTGGSMADLVGTTLEQPPGQPNGGGFNSTLSANTITAVTPVANGASVNVRIVLGDQQNGAFRFCATLEGLPAGNNAIAHTGSTLDTSAGPGCARPENVFPDPMLPPPTGGDLPPLGTSPAKSCSLVASTIIGTARADTRVGTRKPDTMFGLAGDDRLRGDRGRDCVDGGMGDDRLFGGRGADLLFGGAGADLIDGEDGVDRLRGLAATKRPTRGDILSGDAGDDRLVDRRGIATLSGGTGNDRLIARDASIRDRRRADTLTCGAGSDSAIVDRADKVAADCERVRRR